MRTVFGFHRTAAAARIIAGVKLLTVIPSGAQVAYLDVGARTAPAFIYLGGLGLASSVTFAPVIGHPAVAGRGRHVVIDLLGSGWSDHDDEFAHTIEDHASVAAAVIDALGLRGVTLVGHSLGGSIAISLATRRADLVGELVVAEPNLDPGVGTMSARIASYDEDAFAAGGVRDLVEPGDTSMGARTLRRWSPRGRVAAGRTAGHLPRAARRVVRAEAVHLGGALR